jgi:predicted RNA-binding Zn-ribbon protein involved in translation (DUF1610 family)
VSEKGEAMNEQPDKVGEQPVSHRENTWTVYVCPICGENVQWDHHHIAWAHMLDQRDDVEHCSWDRDAEPIPVEVVSSEWRERAERAEAERAEARALALELGAAVFVCPEHGVDGQPRCPVCAALARVRALADNESRNDG